MTRKVEWTKYNPFLNEEVKDEPFVLEDEELDSKKLISTAFGIIELDDRLNPLRDINFWMCDTNFPVTKEIAYTLDNAEGVSVFRVLDKYKFIIGIARLFDEDIVKTTIETSISSTPILTQEFEEVYSEKYLKRALEKQEELSQEDLEYWAFYIFPNGKIATIKMKRNEEPENFISKFAILHKSQELSGGILVCSDGQ